MAGAARPRALLLGLLGAVVLASADGARRTDTTYPDRGRTAVPVRSALAGNVIAVAAVVTAGVFGVFGVFGASLAGLIGTPREYGQNWDAISDLGFGGVSPQNAARLLAATPAVAHYAPG